MTCYIDDILVSSKDEESYFAIPEELLSRLNKHNFRFKLEKCEYLH